MVDSNVTFIGMSDAEFKNWMIQMIPNSGFANLSDKANVIDALMKLISCDSRNKIVIGNKILDYVLSK